MPIGEAEGVCTMDPELHTKGELWPQAGDHGANALCILIIAVAQPFTPGLFFVIWILKIFVNIRSNTNRRKMFASISPPYKFPVHSVIFLLQSVHTSSGVFCQVHYL